MCAPLTATQEFISVDTIFELLLENITDSVKIGLLLALRILRHTFKRAISWRHVCNFYLFNFKDLWYMTLPGLPRGQYFWTEKSIVHNYKQFDDKDIYTKDARTPLLCTEHLGIGNKACSVKRLNGDESEAARAIQSWAISNLVISM